MSTLVLTGPPASGKNTIAEQLAKRLRRCAVIDVDDLRQMAVEPYSEPWQGEEGARQQMLGVRNACALVHNFDGDDFDVIVIDVLTDETAALYREKLKGIEVMVVSLLPSEDEVNSRLLSRPDFLSRGDTDWMYEQQSTFTGFDEQLDSTEMTPEDAAEWFLQHWSLARR